MIKLTQITKKFSKLEKQKTYDNQYFIYMNNNQLDDITVENSLIISIKKIKMPNKNETRNMKQTFP